MSPLVLSSRETQAVRSARKITVSMSSGFICRVYVVDVRLVPRGPAPH